MATTTTTTTLTEAQLTEAVKSIEVDQLLTAYGQASVKVAECDYTALLALEVLGNEIKRRIG